MHGLLYRIQCIVIEIYIYICDSLFAVECSSKAKLHGKTVIITGGTTGIGKETALDLAARGAKLILGCLDIEKGQIAANDILKVVKDAKVIVKLLDLASFSSIRQFAAEVLKNEPHIHILINNAGVLTSPKLKTTDGFETHFGVNYLGHFLLTHLLLDRIKASAPARIINVSSFLYSIGDVTFDYIKQDLECPRFLHYCNSKLASMLFTRELARRLEGTGVSTYCLHPGSIDTEIMEHLVTSSIIEYWKNLLSSLTLKTPRQGAQTTIFCAVEEKIAEESGLYYCACKSLQPLPKATDDISSKVLWKLSEKLINSVEIESSIK